MAGGWRRDDDTRNMRLDDAYYMEKESFHEFHFLVLTVVATY